MRVLLVNSYYYPIELGGAEVSVRKLAEELVKNDIEVFVLCNGKESDELINNVNVIRREFNKFEINGIKRTNVYSKIYKKIVSTKNIFSANEIKKVIMTIKPDVIHVNNIYNISTEIWSIAKKLDIPIIQTLRDYFLICPKANLMCDGHVCNDKKIICKLYNKYNKKNFENVNFITAPSKCTLELFEKSGAISGISSKVIYNAIDKTYNKLIDINSIREKRFLDKKIKFCYLGALTEYKGVREMLDVFTEIKSNNIELHIAGNGILKAYVNDKVNKDNRIYYHGKLNEKDVEELLLNCDVMIVPSKWYEPFGRVVIDAYKYGMPVIASNMGGIEEIVEQNVTGYLINVNNKDEFKNSILKMCNKDEIYRMVEPCINMLNKYSVEKQAKEFLEVYSSVIHNKNI